MKAKDYMVDGGDGREVFCSTLREATKVAEKLSREQKRGIYIYRWVRPDRWSDLEIDDNWVKYVERSPIE